MSARPRYSLACTLAWFGVPLAFWGFLLLMAVTR